MLIAITGKGGVGKTTVSALMVKAIAELKANKEIEGEILKKRYLKFLAEGANFKVLKLNSSHLFLNFSSYSIYCSSFAF